LRELIATHLNDLPEKYRLPLVLHYFDGLTYRQLAAALGEPHGTISTRIAEGRRKLEPGLRRAGLGDAAKALGPLAAGAGLLGAPAALSASAVFAHGAAAAAAGGVAGLGGAAATASGGGVMAMLQGKAALLVAAVVAPPANLAALTLPARNNPGTAAPAPQTPPGPLSTPGSSE